MPLGRNLARALSEGYPQLHKNYLALYDSSLNGETAILEAPINGPTFRVFVSQLGPFHYLDRDARPAQAASAPPSPRVRQVLSIIIPLERPHGPVVNSPSTYG